MRAAHEIGVNVDARRIQPKRTMLSFKNFLHRCIHDQVFKRNLEVSVAQRGECCLANLPMNRASISRKPSGTKIRLFNLTHYRAPIRWCFPTHFAGEPALVEVDGNMKISAVVRLPGAD